MSDINENWASYDAHNIRLTGDVSNYVSQKDLAMKFHSLLNDEPNRGDCGNVDEISRLPTETILFMEDGTAMDERLNDPKMLIILDNVSNETKCSHPPESNFNWALLIYFIAIMIIIYLVYRNFKK